MYKTGVFNLTAGNGPARFGKLGLSKTNQLFYNDGTAMKQSLPEYKNSVVLLPSIVEEHTGKTLVTHQFFSPNHLYAIMNHKMKHGELVTYLIDEQGRPRLNAKGQITIIPFQEEKFSLEYLLDTLHDFGMEVRANPGKDLDVDSWFAKYRVSVEKQGVGV